MGIGVCGDNCEICPRFQATLDGSEESLAEVARLWLRLGFRDRLVSNGEISCHGCESDNNCPYRDQRDCAFGRGLASCGSCGSYPCELTERTFRETAELRRRIEGCPDFARVEEAFFRKKENLDRVSEERGSELGNPGN